MVRIDVWRHSSQPLELRTWRPMGYSRVPSLAQDDNLEVAMNDDPDAEFGGHEARRKLERRLLRKLDLRMSILTVIYILNYVDRNNVGAARMRGFERDLRLQGTEFATLLSIFYVGYVLMQVPSNMLLVYIGKPSLYLPACVMVWGTISILTGTTTNFRGALLMRFFLGFVEASFFPGALFLMSKWYKRSELGTRVAIFYSGNTISTAFGAFIASVILNGMDGKLGRAAWRWLFYIEGAFTIFVAICAMLILPDYPATTSWLTNEERRLAMRRMEEDAEVTEEGGPVASLWMAVTDWKVWWMAVATMTLAVANSFTAYFPTLSATMGFNPTVTLLLCAPPFILAAIMAFIVSRHSDKTGERFYHIAGPILGGIVGFIIAMCTMNTAARYASLFLMAHMYAGGPVLYAWISNSFPRPPSKRAIVFALVNAITQIGSMVGSYVWPSAWGPTYRNSFAICTATAGCGLAMCYIFKLVLAQLNRQLEEKEREEGIEESGFRYLL